MADKTPAAKLIAGITSSLRKEYRELLKGAEGDVEKYVDTIAGIMARAIVSGNEDLIEESKAQVLSLYELNRIRYVRGAKTFLIDAVVVALKVVSAVIARSLTGGLLG